MTPPEAELSQLLVGHKIVRVTQQSGRSQEGSLFLDDGTELIIVPNEGCGGCDAGNYTITALGIVDNVITAVRLNLNSDVTCIDFFDIFVVTDAAEQLLICRVEGFDNGHYGAGYTIKVKRP